MEEIHEVDIDKAQAAMKFMTDYVSRNREEIEKAEAAAQEALMGLILTAIHTRLIPNATPATTEFRAKVFMAFDIGYVHGRLSGKGRMGVDDC